MHSSMGECCFDAISDEYYLLADYIFDRKSWYSLISCTLFIFRYTLSHDDALLAANIGASVDATKYPHIARWCAHIRSYTDAERNRSDSISNVFSSSILSFSWPKASGSGDTAVSAKKPTTDAGGDDDFDLFGSDDEEDNAEKERITQERLKVCDRLYFANIFLCACTGIQR